MGESCHIVSKATVTVVDVDSGAEEKITVSSPGAATGLNLKENQRIYFGGLPSIANYRYVYSEFLTSDSLITTEIRID